MPSGNFSSPVVPADEILNSDFNTTNGILEFFIAEEAIFIDKLTLKVYYISSS